MAITLKERNRLVRAVQRRIRAVVANEWKGAGHPDDNDEIERELKAANEHYWKVLREITQPAQGQGEQT